MRRLNFLYILLLGAFLASCTQSSSKLEVISPSGETLELTAFVDESVTGKVTIKNVGDANLSFDIKVTNPDNLAISTEPSKGNIGKNESVEITVNVTCPNEENTYEAKITLETNDINKTFTVKLTCQALKLPELEIISPSGETLELTAPVNKSVTGKITIKNVGDANLNFEIKVTDNLVISTEPSKGNISKNESVDITVNVTCPNEENTYEAKITLETNDINKTFTVKLTCQTPKLPELVAGQWNEFQGGKDTMCANGSNYKYFAYKGNTNKLVIDFMGGGACWNDNSCPFPNSNPNPAIGQGFYDDSIPSDLSTGTTGIYDKGNSSNPTKDWYHVFAPYCTGDLQPWQQHYNL